MLILVQTKSTYTYYDDIEHSINEQRISLAEAYELDQFNLQQQFESDNSTTTIEFYEHYSQSYGFDSNTYVRSSIKASGIMFITRETQKFLEFDTYDSYYTNIDLTMYIDEFESANNWFLNRTHEYCDKGYSYVTSRATLILNTSEGTLSWSLDKQSECSYSYLYKNSTDALLNLIENIANVGSPEGNYRLGFEEIQNYTFAVKQQRWFGIRCFPDYTGDFIMYGFFHNIAINLFRKYNDKKKSM